MKNGTSTIHLSAEITQQLEQAANERGCSRDGLAQQAVADWLAWQEEKHQMIVKALEDVDQNRLYSQEEMLGWAEDHQTHKAA